jgi:hypothetical protein
MAIEKDNAFKVLGKNSYSDVLSVKIIPEKPHQFRILPQKKSEKYALFEFLSHWIEQQTGVRYPIFHEKGKKDCKLCNYVQSLWMDVNQMKEDGMTDDSPEVKAKKNLLYACRATNTYDCNALDRNDYKDPSTGKIQVKRWTFGKQIFAPIHELAVDDEWGSPSHDENGYDIKVIGHKQGQQNLQYTVTGAKNTSPLTDEEIEALNARGYDLSKIRTQEFIPESKVKEILMNAKVKEIQALYGKSQVDEDEDDDDLSVVTIKQKDEVVVQSFEVDDLDASPKPARGRKPAAAKKADEELIVNDEEDDHTPVVTKEPQITSDKKKIDEVDEDSDIKPRGKKGKKDKDVEEEPVEELETLETTDPEFEEEEEEGSEFDESEIAEFNSYECKGLYDSSDQACIECDFINLCTKLAKLAEDAEAMGVDPRKNDLLMTETEIKELMKLKKASAPKKGKKVGF